MKKLLLILLCLPMIGFGQQTYVPDDNFEAYLEANGMGNGIANDDYVTTANIDTVTYLDVSQNNISDLTGIEDFIALTHLRCFSNNLTSLDVSQNTALTELNCNDNSLTSLNVSGATALDILNCRSNQLTSLDVSNNTALTFLNCYFNQLSSLNLSGATALASLSCNDNQLTSLNLKNINYFNIGLNTTQNPALVCIEVSDSTVATNALSNGIDSWTHFSEDCDYVTSLEEHTINKELLKVTDLLGRETQETNQPLFYIYDDGTVEKRIVIE